LIVANVVFLFFSVHVKQLSQWRSLTVDGPQTLCCLLNGHMLAKVNTLASGCFRRFLEKNLPKRTWLCTEISPLLYALRTWSKCQKTWQVF